MAEKKTTVQKKTANTGIDWEALGYEEESEEYTSADDIKVNTGPTRFRVQANKKYRIGFPFVAPSKKGGFEVRLKPVEHLKFYDDAEQRGARFIMPKDAKLRKEISEVFGSKSIQTHYLTPIVVYDTNDEGKLLSRDSVSYSVKILAITPGRYAKLKEAASKFNLADYDFIVSLEGDEKTEHFQKMVFDSVTMKKDLMAKTAMWQKGLVQLPDDEDDEPIPVTMEQIIAECYEIAPEMEKVLGTSVLKDSKIKEILAEWSDIDDEDDESYYDEEDDEEVDEPEDEDDEPVKASTKKVNKKMIDEDEEEETEDEELDEDFEEDEE